MKRSEFVTEVLNDFSNTVFTTKEQVESALELFIKLGMLPPTKEGTTTFKTLDNGDIFVELWGWEDE